MGLDLHVRMKVGDGGERTRRRFINDRSTCMVEDRCKVFVKTVRNFMWLSYSYIIYSKARRRRSLPPLAYKGPFKNYAGYRYAFDSIWRLRSPMEGTQLLWISQEDHQPVDSTIPEISSAGRVNDELTEWFRTTVGVRQGCNLATVQLLHWL